MKEVSKPLLSPYRWVILIVMWSAIFVGVVTQFQVAALAYKIIPLFKLNSRQFAMIFSAPMLSAVFLSLVAGALADKFGVKAIVSSGFVFSILGVFFRYSAHDFKELFILMFLSGISSAVLNANASKLLGAWFPKEQMGTAMGIYFSASYTGMGIALATSALFPTIKSAFLTAGFLMTGVWILWMAFIKAKPEGAPDLPFMPVTRYIGVAARSRNVWMVGVVMMFFMGATIAFSGFLPNALHEVRGLNPIEAGLIASIVTFTNIIGSIIGPVISDYTGKIKPFLAPVALLAAFVMYTSWLVLPGVSMWALLALTGILTGIIAPLLMAFPMLLPEIGPVYAGSAGGIIATLQLIGAFFIPSFIIAPLAGQNYNMLFALSSFCMLISGAVTLFLPELGFKARKDTKDS
ncbi:putative sulfoacetate transporter SauU [Moorella thermoacetica]|uniref:Sulfoacetate transporter SauU n=1 Tax=Neomoorella thermoacetica TaxID=1525 RepID=A0AAC9MUV0_NEOTH|nr:MFS transporter [Moorella thermoacetica]AOQ24044.1 putative sulfoacetate transporter SauU [Moorella thermoacetica]TYL14448.1 putative sulfoacetate transporter SauU [Moorella thermoacetica]